MSLIDHDSYRAFLERAAWFPASLQWSRFTGTHAAATLNGLVTNDVAALRDGDAQLAAVLTPKGKIVADLVIVRDAADVFRVAAPVAAAVKWMEIVRKYVNPRFCAVADESPQHESAMLVGPASDALAATAPASLLATRAPMLGTVPVVLLRWNTADAGVASEWRDAAAIPSGAPEILDVIRVEAGMPAWGRDMDEATLPQEANLGTLAAISFAKGCYTGQETVARIHFRGHVNRQLRGLVAATPMHPGAAVMVAGIDGGEAKVVGSVTSAVVSPRFGPIALAMLRREVEAGATVQTGHGGEFGTARVVVLPFTT